MDTSSASAQYQQTGTGTQTGNPQNIPTSSLQPQSSSLQDSSMQTVNALNLLDQGKGVIRVNGKPITVQSAQATPSPQTQAKSMAHLYVYSGIALMVIVFFIVLIYGLFREPS